MSAQSWTQSRVRDSASHHPFTEVHTHHPFKEVQDRNPWMCNSSCNRRQTTTLGNSQVVKLIHSANICATAIYPVILVRADLSTSRHGRHQRRQAQAPAQRKPRWDSGGWSSDLQIVRFSRSLFWVTGQSSIIIGWQSSIIIGLIFFNRVFKHK